MATGTVKWFNATKGFGFIQPTRVGPTCSFTSAPSSAPGCVTSTKARRSPMMLSRTSAPASRQRTISNQRDGAFAYLLRLRLMGTTRTVRSYAKAEKRLATTSAAPSQPQPRLWSGRSFPALRFLLGSKRLLTIEREGLRSSRRPRWEAEAARTGCQISLQVIGAGRQSDRPVH